MNIEAKNLSKIYGDGENRVVALDHANLEIVSSDFISIMGPSGSGKSTLLHLLSGLDKPSSGSLTYDGITLHGHWHRDRALPPPRRPLCTAGRDWRNEPAVPHGNPPPSSAPTVG